MGLLGAVIVVALALVTASVAETKGQSGLLWFVLGLFFPVVSLLIAALLHPTRDASPVVPPVEEAVRSSSVARALLGTPSQSAHELQDGPPPCSRTPRMRGCPHGTARQEANETEVLGRVQA